MPVESAFFALFSFSVAFPFATRTFRHKNLGRLGLDVEHHELLPVESLRLQVQWGLLRVYWGPVKWNINRLDKASANTIRDRLNEFLLRRPLGIIDSEDVLLLRWGFENLFDHARQIFDVNRRHEILALANDG